MDLSTGEVLTDLNPDRLFYIGSVRKLFTVAELLTAVGAGHHYVTKVYRDGEISNKQLKGNLILLASGDLAMGGHTNPDGSFAIPDFDHNEADSLGNAQLTNTNPILGYQQLAKQVKASGIDKISGDLVIDERLFTPFNFRGQFNVSSIFINDDVVDLHIEPTKLASLAKVDVSPQSAAFSVVNNLKMGAAKSKYTLQLDPVVPKCLGQVSCKGTIKGTLPLDFSPPLTHEYPLIQVFRITEPADYARTVFIEALKEAGVDISEVRLVKKNPSELLKAGETYASANQVASLESFPYEDYAKWILKVSYNIGADTSLVLFGLTQGVKSMADALKTEGNMLGSKYGISSKDTYFVDGSGGGETRATICVVAKWLASMSKEKLFSTYLDDFPNMGIDGSLSFVKDYQKEPSLKAATYHVHAKPGSYFVSVDNEPVIKGQAFAGYIDSKKGKKLAYIVVVNNVPVHSFDDLLSAFQDQGTISAILWRDF